MMTTEELCQACQDLLDECQKDKRIPTTQEVYRLACDFENQVGNGFGGELGSVLQDNNWDDASIEVCIANAKSQESILMGKVLLLLRLEQRKDLWDAWQAADDQ